MNAFVKTVRLQIQPAKTNSEEAAPARRSGRATFDSRGNAVWEWRTDTGDYQDETSQRLQLLEAPGLTLEDSTRSNRLERREGDAMAGGGFNPYNRGAEGLAYKPPVRSIQSKFASQAKFAGPAKSASAPKSAESLRRLGEWMQMKKRLATQTEE